MPIFLTLETYFLHPGDWPTVLPITSFALCIENKALYVAGGIWLGLDLCCLLMH